MQTRSPGTPGPRLTVRCHRPTAMAEPHSPLGILLTTLLLLTLGAAPLAADWLVTHGGGRTETRGPWEVRGRMVVFTNTKGTLMSIRASEVDLEASAELTRQAAAPRRQASEPVVTEEPARDPVMVLTNRNVGFGNDGAQGVEALVERLREAHRYQDVGLAMGLVSFTDTPEGMRRFVEDQMGWLMKRRIVDIRLEEIAADENLERVQDGVAYEPNLEVTHKMSIELAPDPADDVSSLSFMVGTRLGSYFIASARPIEDGQ